MVERTVTIRLKIQDEIGDRLLEIKKQRDALLSRSTVNLRVRADGLEQARKTAAQARSESAAAMKDLSALGGAITAKAVKPLAQYQELLFSSLKASRVFAGGVASALSAVSQEFQKQKTLAAFWGVSGLQMGIVSLKFAFMGFLSTGGRGFTAWLRDATAYLAQYRTALTASAAIMVGFATAAGLASKPTQNYIQATLSTPLMERKLTDRKGAEAWIESAQGTDWSAGRAARMGIFQEILSKNPYIGQKGAQKATEDIEKYFFANREMLQKRGIQSAEELASRVSAPQLSGEDASIFEDIFGLGFSRMTAQARLGRISTKANYIDIDEVVSRRPEEVLNKRLTATTQAVGDTIIPILNQVLGAFLDISDAIGKIPGLGKMIGWGAVLAGMASAGLIVVSMIGSLIPGLITVIGLFGKLGMAAKLAAAGQWLLNAAMAANPLGIAIIAIAGLVAGLYMLEKRFGLVTKAWQAFSGSSIGKGIIGYIEGGKKALGDMLSSLDKAYTSGGLKGFLKIALDAMAASNPVLKLLVTIVDFLKKLWTGSNNLNKLFSTGLALWQRMADFFAWLLDSIKSGIKYIKDGLGITKAEAKEKYKKAVEMAGGIEYFNEGGKVGWYDRQGNAVAEEDVPGYLSRALKEYQNAPASVIEGLWNWLVGIFEKLIDAITGLPGAISAAIKSWFPGAGGSEDKDRSPAETRAGSAVEAKAPGAYVMGPNSQKITPSQWPVRYLFDRSGEFGSETVYGPGGAELGVVQDFMTREAAMDTLLQAAKAGGKPSDIPGVSFHEDTWLDLFKSIQQTYPAAQELYNRLASGREGTEIKSDRFGNEYLSPTAPETFEDRGTMYVAFGQNGLFDVWNASGLVKGGFGSAKEADEYISTHSMARGGQIQVTGALVGHGGEEVDPARVVLGGKTTLAKINELFDSFGRNSSIMGGASLTIQAPPVNINIGRIEKDVDIDRMFALTSEEFDRKLLFRLRNSLNAMGLRDIGYMRG